MTLSAGTSLPVQHKMMGKRVIRVQRIKVSVGIIIQNNARLSSVTMAWHQKEAHAMADKPIHTQSGAPLSSPLPRTVASEASIVDVDVVCRYLFEIRQILCVISLDLVIFFCVSAFFSCFFVALIGVK